MRLTTAGHSLVGLDSVEATLSLRRSDLRIALFFCQPRGIPLSLDFCSHTLTYNFIKEQGCSC